MDLVLGTNKIVFGYTEYELAKLIKQLLSLTLDKKVIMSNNKGRATVFFKGDIRLVRDDVRKFLNQRESIISEEANIILPG